VSNERPKQWRPYWQYLEDRAKRHAERGEPAPDIAPAESWDERREAENEKELPETSGVTEIAMPQDWRISHYLPSNLISPNITAARMLS
jgi:hypothetical protein